MLGLKKRKMPLVVQWGAWGLGRSRGERAGRVWQSRGDMRGVLVFVSMGEAPRRVGWGEVVLQTADGRLDDCPEPLGSRPDSRERAVQACAREHLHVGFPAPKFKFQRQTSATRKRLFLLPGVCAISYVSALSRRLAHRARLLFEPCRR